MLVLVYILILFSVLLFLLHNSEKKRIERKEQKIEIKNRAFLIIL